MRKIKEFCKKHKKKIIIGGVVVGVAAGTLLGYKLYKNSMNHSLKLGIDIPKAPNNDMNSIPLINNDSITNQEGIINDPNSTIESPIGVGNDNEICHDPNNTKIIDVSKHLRTLKEGQQHSPQNEEKARMAGITNLPKGVSYIPDYQKGIKSSLQ